MDTQQEIKSSAVYAIVNEAKKYVIIWSIEPIHNAVN